MFPHGANGMAQIHIPFFSSLATSNTFLVYPDLSYLVRFVRRTMGKDAARRAFGDTRALRRTGQLGYRLYLAHASIELHVNGEPDVARRILELGLSQHEGYIAEPEYVLEYVDLLIQVTTFRLFHFRGGNVVNDRGADLQCYYNHVLRTVTLMLMLFMSLTSCLLNDAGKDGLCEYDLDAD